MREITDQEYLRSTGQQRGSLLRPQRPCNVPGDVPRSCPMQKCSRKDLLALVARPLLRFWIDLCVRPTFPGWWRRMSPNADQRFRQITLVAPTVMQTPLDLGAGRS